MQRQKSILSFLQKPSSGNQNGTVAGKEKGHGASQFPSKQQNRSGAADSLEVTGTDTPPEKVPRKVFATRFSDNADAGGSSSLFSSIMHKFVKVDDRVNGSQRYF